MTAAELAAALGKSHREGREWRCLCPAHTDHSPSLSITEKDGQLLVICRAGCDQSAVIAALKARNLWDLPEPEPRFEPRGRGRITATYDYLDEAEHQRFQVVRLEPGRDGRDKDFLQRRREGADWVWNTDGVERIPYHLNELAHARSTANGTPWRVYITEGEKDADRLRRDWHLLATTNPGGAGKWRAAYARYFSGADVVILPDNDEPGRKHAQTVALSLNPVATRVRILPLTGLPPKGDISDWIDQGGDQSTLEDLVDSLPQPPAIGKSHRARSWHELIAMPRPPYIVKGVIEKGVLAEIYGPTQSGKSFLATDLALHIACGWNWCGRRVRQGGVLYVSAEGGTAIVRRLQAFAQHHNVDLDAIDFRAVIEPTNILEVTGIDQLITDALATPNLVLVIIDTAARVMPGSKEDTEAMGKLVAACDAIRAATGACVLLVHHTGKDERLGSRGSSVLPAAVDVNISVSKQGKTASAELEKQRDGQAGPITTFELKIVNLGTDEDGDDITSCVVHQTDPQNKPKRTAARLPANQERALELLYEAINQGGHIPPASNHIPPNRHCVAEQTWREYCYRGDISRSDAQDTKRIAFNRAAEALIAKHLVGKWDDWCWPVTHPSEQTNNPPPPE